MTDAAYRILWAGASLPQLWLSPRSPGQRPLPRSEAASRARRVLQAGFQVSAACLDGTTLTDNRSRFP